MIKSLELLRFTAAMLVVFAHMPSFNGVNIFNGSLFSGAIGVDLFFIISGFVMYLSSRELFGVLDASKFLVRRIFRVMPLYMLVSLVYLVATKSYTSISIDYVLKSFFLLPIQDGNGSVLDPLLYLGWTLRFEMFFYLLASISAFTKFKVPVIIMLVLSSVLLCEIYGFYFGETIIFEFLMGYLLAATKDRLAIMISGITKYQYTALFSILTLLLIVSTGTDSSLGTSSSSGAPRMSIIYDIGLVLPRWLVWGMPSALLVLWALSHENKHTWKLSFLGKYTYSVYLLQAVMIPLVNKVFPASIYPVSFCCLLVIAMSTASYVVYSYFENPINKFARVKLLNYFRSN
jgi:peptidoglycan/LPS O-acetylase OafA/YrhL